jgi:lauroyl/myristoyl acyltransferase
MVRMDRFLNSRTGLSIAMALARMTPPWFGYGLARLVSGTIAARRRSDLVRAVRANQWVVSGEQATPQELDRAVRGVINHSARAIYELYHHAQDLGNAGPLFSMDSSFKAILDRPHFDQRGLVVAGLHMSGFDLAFQWACLKWVKPLALTLPDPQDGRRMEFELRQKIAQNLVPGSVGGLRQAIRYLEQGGLVTTGIDRPVPGVHPTLRFFNRPASLPSLHVFLALKARVPVVLAASRSKETGGYHLFASPPIEMDPHLDRLTELQRNGEKILEEAEKMIRQDPQQWLVPIPVWPEALEQAPK